MHATPAGAPRPVRRRRPLAAALLAAALVASSTGCGSSDGGGGGWTCADPLQKLWLRSWIDQTYLWYREVPNADPNAYATPVDYFDVLKTPALTASGRPKDRFHFTYPTAEWIALSQSGVEAGYGAQWVLLSATPPRRVRVAYVEPGSPAAVAGLTRGTDVLSVDGVDLVNDNTAGGVATLNAGLFPPAPGATHVLGVSGPAPAGYRTVTVTSAAVAGTPVLIAKVLPPPSDKVGYLLFNDHVAPAEGQLVTAIGQLQAAGVTDLVLDLRYNGGGYLDIANELAYMIAGPAATAGKIFERLVFNDKAGANDPITGGPNLPYPFHTTAQGFSGPTPGTPLPALGLARLYVLTGGGTCSASESIVNGLRGVGVQVVQVGTTTCGKPYGFYPQDLCGTTYFAIQFQGVNQAGYGDYGDGFVPGGAGANGVTGCAVADDLDHQLGDPAEARLAMALGHRASGTCTPLPSLAGAGPRAVVPADGLLVRSPLRENRILIRR